jgi:hypothetical protein
MNRDYDIAQLLVSCWALSDPGHERKLPTSNAILDRALQIAVARRLFPDWVRDSLNFVDSRMGLQCVELPLVLDWAQRARLTNAPNPSYQFTEVNVSEFVARQLLRRLGVSSEDAASWGTGLRQALKEAELQAKQFEDSELLVAS